MKYKKLKIAWLTVFTFLLCLISVSGQDKNADRFRIVYDDESNRTTIILNGIELPKNKDSFSVGASFEFDGKILEKMPCCAVLFFTSISKNQFKYKENHNLKIWADKETFDFGRINWRESYYGYAFIIAGIAYPEELFVGMETDKFSKIVNSTKIKAELGSFKFDITKSQTEGLRDLENFMKSNIGKDFSENIETK